MQLSGDYFALSCLQGAQQHHLFITLGTAGLGYVNNEDSRIYRSGTQHKETSMHKISLSPTKYIVFNAALALLISRLFFFFFLIIFLVQVKLCYPETEVILEAG